MVTNNSGTNSDFKEVLPLLPIRDLVVYPFMILPLFVGRESSIQAVDHALNKTDRMILLSSQKDIRAEVPNPDEIYEIGTVAMIMRMRKLPDGRIKILVQGLSKVRILSYEQSEPYFISKVALTEEPKISVDEKTIDAITRTVKTNLEKVIQIGKVLSPDLMMVLEDIKEPGRLADLIASNLNLQVAEGQLILETFDSIERLQRVNELLERELEIISMQSKIKSSAKTEMNRNQKEFYLREQMKAIRSELGEGESGVDAELDEFQELKQKIQIAKMDQETEKEMLKQLSRLEKMHPESSESNIIRTYIETVTDLPWNIYSEENIELNKAKEVLDHDHFELEKVKERILEFLAVRSLKGAKSKAPILCFSGPPGVGKTSLGKSIAKATGRKFVRIALGGVKDESEIRGHRRTYVGAMPGRLIQAIKEAGTLNPVILLDEVDKISSDYKGDPTGALLEVLDPEQNWNFRDHYLNIAFDLSNVMFIATANYLENVPAPLRDRMEILNLTGYTQEEKLEISKRYIIPKQMDENGITSEHIDFSEDSVVSVIKNFTAEAGLRNLERKIGALCRKVATKIAKGEVSKTHILPKTVEKLLGPPMYSDEDRDRIDEIGVSTGLAWTSVGGAVLQIESTSMRGRGLTLTGQLGDVMKESAQTAIGYIRSHAKEFGIDESFFEENEIHVHIPAGATPKDGPSAGITLATALVSLLTGLPVRNEVAMTGEMTLKGKVLPIGGLKEKALAAMRLEIPTIIIPWKNKKDLIEISEEYRAKINFMPVKEISEVLEIALVGWKERIEKLNKAKNSSSIEQVTAA